MLDRNEREPPYRPSSTTGAVARDLDRSDGTPGSSTADDSKPNSGDDSDRDDCPLCEFSSAADGDVYVHLMTAHRKSTISEMLLRYF